MNHKDTKPQIMKIFEINCRGKIFRFKCDDVINGVPINPKLPVNFDSTPNEARDDKQRAWFNVPFIRTVNMATEDFNKHFPEGRFDVRCLDGGAWDRSTAWGCFKTMAAAIASIPNYCGTFQTDTPPV